MVKVIGGTFEDINEAIIKPLSDEVGQAIEQGVQSVSGITKPQTNTQQQQDSKLDDQKKLADWRWRLQKIKELEDEQRRIREEKQKQMQIVQQTAQTTQVKNMEISEKRVIPSDLAAKGKPEIKRGVGG